MGWNLLKNLTGCQPDANTIMTTVLFFITSSTIMFLSFRTGRSGQTVQTQIRLLLIRVYTVCNSLCIFWMHYSKERPSCSTFRVITANFRLSKILGFLRYLIFTGKNPLKTADFGNFINSN